MLALWSSFGPGAGLYTLLFHTVPVFSLLRAPARFALAVTLALTVFSAAGLTLLLGRMKVKARIWVAAAVLIFAVAELSTTIPYDEVRPVARAYKVLASAEPGPVAEFPFYYLGHERYMQTRYMLGSTTHWLPLVNGYSDFIPKDFFEGALLLQNFPDDAGLKWLRARDTRYVVFYRHLYDDASRARLDERIAAHATELRPLYTLDTIHLYERHRGSADSLSPLNALLYGELMSRIAVVTSSPPMVEGGHMVIARSLVEALREAGHHADIIVTPQNRFGRQASAYLATWLTDVDDGGRPRDRPGDQPALSELRGSPPEARLLAQSHDAGVLRPVGLASARRSSPRA